GSAQRNGKGVMVPPDGGHEEIDFTGAPPVRHLALVRIVGVEMLDDQGRSVRGISVGSAVRFRIVLESRLEKRGVHLGLIFSTDGDVHVSTNTNAESLGRDGAPNPVALDLLPRLLEAEVHFPSLRLGMGHYWVTIGMSPGFEHFAQDDLLFYRARSFRFTVSRPGPWMKVLYEPA